MMVDLRKPVVRARRRLTWLMAFYGCAAAVGVASLVAIDRVGGMDDPRLRAPILALYRDDGVVFAEVAACGDDRVRSFVVEQLITDPEVPEYFTGSVWAVVPAPAAPKVTKIRLYEVPSGWQLSTMHGPLTTDTDLAPAEHYLVWIRTDRDDQAAFAFPTGRLVGTGPQSLLTSSGRDRVDGEPDSTVRPRHEFDERVRRYCEETGSRVGTIS